ncbi:Aspartate--tRNA ligase, cytoplasmic, partial [Araneus ventricosus]
ESKQEEEDDYSKDCYGNMAMIQSREKVPRTLVPVSSLEKDLGEEKVWIRGRLHTSRAKGKQCFFVVRQRQFTIQCLLSVSETTSKQMIKFVASITKESIIDVEGFIRASPQTIESCSQKNVEMHVTKVFVVSSAEARLPLQIEDASRPENENGFHLDPSKPERSQTALNMGVQVVLCNVTTENAPCFVSDLNAEKPAPLLNNNML